jgi:uncharacterized protein YutE (UPF0331/DUF86 family)
MTPKPIRAEVVLEKLAWVRGLIDELRALPLGSIGEFLSDTRNPAAAESYLRRSLEGVLDLGRHILAKAFGEGVAEYKQVAERLAAQGVIGGEEQRLLTEMAGYRNRLVHFYDEITREELYSICASRLGDVDTVLDRLLDWLRRNPDRLDTAL